MKDILLSMLTAASYAVFLRNLLFSGGLGASEVLRAAQRNSEILMSSLLVSLFSGAAAGLCFEVTRRLAIFEYAWLAALYGAVLLVLYLATCVVIALLPRGLARHRPILLRRIGISALNTIVMGVPLLAHRMGESLPGAIGMGLGAGLAFLVVTMLINSGLHILQQNKAIPFFFNDAATTEIYTGLLALAFTGFKGEILFL
jgi:Na+-translocating ferredoxin:NAD+ oxidoreductase RnfA subunit